jgi:hypothetical protein
MNGARANLQESINSSALLAIYPSECYATGLLNRFWMPRNSRTVVARKAAGQRRAINERLGLGVFESRRCRSGNRCPPESKTGERLVYNTGIPGV